MKKGLEKSWNSIFPFPYEPWCSISSGFAGKGLLVLLEISITLANAGVNLRLKLPYFLKMFHLTFLNNKNLYDTRLLLC